MFEDFYKDWDIAESADKVDAKFKKGVLSITLPKTAEAQKSTRKIQIKVA